MKGYEFSKTNFRSIVTRIRTAKHAVSCGAKLRNADGIITKYSTSTCVHLLDVKEGFQYLGHSNWTKCNSLSSFCARIFHFHTGSPFLLPQRSNNQKWEIFQLQNWMRQGDSSAWDIQTGPNATH